MSNIIISPQSGIIEFNTGIAGSDSLMTSTAPIRLDATGGDIWFTGSNVGIGTTDPQFTLDVEGAIHGTSGNFSTAITVGGNPVMTGASPEADTLQTVTDRGATTTNTIRIESTDFASLVLDRGASNSSVVQFENDNGIIGGIGGYNDDGLIFRSKDGNQMALNASNNFGIGTISPSAKLQVNTPNHNTIALAIGNDSYTGGFPRHELLMLNNGSLTWYLPDNGSTPSKLQFYSRDTATYPFTIDSDTASVGIGTNNPSAKLEIKSTVGTNFQQFNTTTNGNVTFGVFDANSRKSFRINSDNGSLDLKFRTSSNRIYFGSQDDVQEVGINTVDPQATLHIHSPDSSVLRLANNEAVYDDSQEIGIDFYGRWYSGQTSVLKAKASIVALGDTDGYSRGQLSFRVANGAVPSEAVRINRQGKVGIGTTDPQNNLHVIGTLRVGPYFSTSDRDHLLITPGGTVTTVSTPNETVNYDNSGGNIHIRTNSGYATPVERLTVTSAGNVGIGTTSPDSKLHIDSTGEALRFTRSSQETYRVIHGTSGLYFTRPNSSALAFGLTQNSDFDIFDTSANVMFRADASTGNVGIGLTPSYKLDVSGDSTSGVIAVRNAANGRDTFRSENASGTRTFNIGNDVNGHGLVLVRGAGGTATSQIAGNGDTFFDTDTLYIDHSANRVGIGTTSPNAILEIAGSSSDGVLVSGGTNNRNTKLTAGNLVYTTTSSSGWAMSNYVVKNSDASTLGHISGGFGSANALTYTYYGGTAYNNAAMYILSSNKNVGIGTSSPSEKLDIYGNAVFSEGGSGNKITIGYNTSPPAGSAGSGLWHIGSGKMWLKGYSSVHIGYNKDVTVTDAGNVGIGTTSPTAKLHVEGVVVAGTTSRIALGSYLDTFSGFYPVISTNNHGDHSFGLNLRVDSDRRFTTVNSHGQITGGAVVIAGNGHPFGANSIYFMSQASGSATSGTEVNYTQARMIVKNDGNVGIGTTSPAHKLTVSAANNTTAVGFDIGSNASFDFSANSTSGYTTTFHMDNTGLDIGHSSSSRSLNLKTNGADRLTIEGGGNVGIGTNSPSSVLEVVDSSVNPTARGIIIRNTASSNDPDFRIGVGYSGMYDDSLTIFKDSTILQYLTSQGTFFTQEIGIATNKKIKAFNSGLAYLDIYNGSANTELSASTDLIFKTTGTERVRIKTSSGNVGIGLNNPSDILQVKSSMSIIDSNGTNVHCQLSSNASEGTLRLHNGANWGLIARGQSNNPYLGAYYGGQLNIVGFGASDGSVIQDPLAVFDFGNSQFKLHDSKKLVIGDGSDLQIFHNGSHSYIHNDTGNIYIENDTTDGDIFFKSDNGSGGLATYFKLDGGTTTLQAYKDLLIANDTARLKLGASQDLQIYHNGSDSYVVNSTGDLEIINNTDDGDIKLVSDNGSGGTATYVSIDGSAVQTRFFKDTRHTDGVKANFGNSDDLQIYHDGSNSFIKDTGTGSLYIDGSQNVFIRDTNGQVWFQGNAGGVNLRYQDSVKIQTTTSGVSVTGSMVAHAAVVNQVTAATSSGSIKFKNNSGSDKAIILDNGNFGIGTNSPDHKLRVSDGNIAIDSDQAFIGNRYRSFVASNTNIQLNNTTDMQFNLHNAAMDFKFGLQGSDPFFIIGGDGNVGIGTTSPTTKLHVAGTASIDTLEYNSIVSVFGQSRIKLNELSDVFYQADKRFTVTGGSPNFFNGNFDSAGNLPTNTTNVININVAGQQGVPSNGITYPQGAVYISFYYTNHAYTAISLRHKSNGVYYSSTGTDVSTNSSYKVIKFPISGNNYLTDIEISITTDANLVKVAGINYLADRWTTQLELPYVSKYLTSNTVFGEFGISGTSGSAGPHLKLEGTYTTWEIENQYTGGATNDMFRIRNTATSSDSLVINRLTNYVGIGITDPDTELEVGGTIKASTHADAIVIGSPTTVKWKMGVYGANDLLIRDPSNNTKFSILSGGNVGIGTTNPSTKLQVGDGTAEDVIRVYHSDSTYLNVRGYGLEYARSVNYIIPTTDTNKSLNIGYNALRWNDLEFNASGKFVFKNNTTELVRIKTDGDVGIGTSGPESKLHIIDSGSSTQLRLNQTGNNDAVLGSGTNFFTIKTGTAGNTNALSILHSNQNVGIGETAPEVKLEVAGDIMAKDSFVSAGATASQGYTFHDFGTGWGYKGVQSPSRLAMFTASAERVTIDADGKVGIGTISPEQELHVYQGTTKLESTNGNDFSLQLGRSDNANLWNFNHAGGDLRIHNDGGNGYDILFGVNAGGGVINNKVGIGTASPNNKLDVVGSTSTDVLQHGSELTNYWALGTTASYQQRVTSRSAAAITQVIEGHSSQSADLLQIRSNGSANGDHMTVSSSGNVGIGDASPISKLHVQDGDIKTVQASGAFDGGTFAAHAYDVNGRYAKYLFGINDTTYQRGMIYERTSGRISIINNTNTTGMNERLTVTTSGKVGIGTNNPTQFFEAFPDLNFSGVIGKAHLGYVGYSDYAAFSHFDQANTSGYALRQGSLGDTLLNAKSGQHIYFRKNNSTIGGFNSSDDFYVDTDSLYVDVSANSVGIGTTSPASELDVDGVTTSKGFRTNTSNTNYNLITRNSTSTTLYVQAAQSNSTQTIASFRYGSATANAGTETFRIRRDNINVFGANFTVDGSITGNSKNFSIKHPTKEGKRLVHSCLEGPEVGVYFRGRSKSNIIEMPDYWGGLVHLDSMTVELTAIGPNQDLYVEDIAGDGEITVGSNTETPLNYFYVVYGERKDIGKLDIEVIDAEYSDESTD